MNPINRKTISTLSDVVLLGAEDFKIQSADPNVRINMSSWYYKEAASPICEICLGGCVLRNELKLNDSFGFLVSLGDIFATAGASDKKIGSFFLWDIIYCLDSIKSNDFSGAYKQLFHNKTFNEDKLAKLDTIKSSLPHYNLLPHDVAQNNLLYYNALIALATELKEKGF